MKAEKLEWGYKRCPGIPEDTRALWGARAVVEHGNVYLLGDRQSTWSETVESLEALVKCLNAGPLNNALNKARDLLKTGRMSGMTAEHFILHESPDLTIAGNTGASYGYLYLTAWLGGGNDK